MCGLRCAVCGNGIVAIDRAVMVWTEREGERPVFRERICLTCATWLKVYWVHE